MKKHTSKSPQVLPNNPAFPARRFDGLLRDLPGERAFLSPSPAGYYLQAWRQRRGARTTRLRRMRKAFSSGAIKNRAWRLPHPSHPAPNVSWRSRYAPLYRSARRANL